MIGVVSGNPRPGSRTLGVAVAVGERVAAALGEDLEVIDLAGFGARLFDPEDDELRALQSRLLQATAVVIASPTYKASFTGLLKLFLDRFAAGSFAGHLAVPVMTGGSPGHSLAVDVHLRPVLIELGASLPTRGLYVTEAQLTDLDATVDAWWETASPLITGTPVGART